MHKMSAKIQNSSTIQRGHKCNGRVKKRIMSTQQFLPFHSYRELFQLPTNFHSIKLTGEKIMQTVTLNPAQPVETDALTARTRGTWMSGDFGKIAQSYAPGAAEFIARLNL